MCQLFWVMFLLTKQFEYEKQFKKKKMFEDQTNTDGAIIIVQTNQRLSIISVIQALMRKTTADQVVEGLESECRGDGIVAAKMSNQTLV